MTAAAPNDDELLEVLTPAFDRPLTLVARSAYRYATSHALEEVHLHVGDSATTLIFKDLSWDRLLPEAEFGKPRFLHDPSRELDSYRHLLGPSRTGPRCHATVDEPGRRWLFLEKVPGVELWQVGDPETWDQVARWLASFHHRVAAGAAQGKVPSLLVRDGADLAMWLERAHEALISSPHPEAAALRHLLEDAPTPDTHEIGPSVFLHGEFYPSNVLVAGSGAAATIWPIDWEMAAVGPAAFDLAALTTGWQDASRLRMVDAYRSAHPEPPPTEDLHRQLDRTRLHLALQWIGWAPRWRAPAEHAHDWVHEAMDAAARLGW